MIYSAPQAVAGTEYDGTTAALGRCSFGGTDGRQQIRVNAIVFATSGVISTWSLRLVDPGDGAVYVIDSGTSTSFILGGPSGFLMLPTNADGTPWRLELVTTGMDGTSSFKVDYDPIRTEL